MRLDSDELQLEITELYSQDHLKQTTANKVEVMIVGRVVILS